MHVQTDMIGVFHGVAVGSMFDWQRRPRAGDCVAALFPSQGMARVRMSGGNTTLFPQSGWFSSADSHRVSAEIMPMNNIFDVAEAKKPIFGSSSVIAPVIGALGFFALIHLHPSDPAGFGGAFIAIYFIFGSFVLGLIFSIIGFVRRERMKGLYLLGFMINMLPAFFAMSGIFR